MRVLKEEGVGALARGTAARAMWLAPGLGITIAVFERVHRFLGAAEHDSNDAAL